MYFFFQEEDGIRDIGVTGVQTCALPIFAGAPGHACRLLRRAARRRPVAAAPRERRGAGPRRGDRKSVVQGKSVDLGGRRIIKKKNNTSTVASSHDIIIHFTCPFTHYLSI